MYFNLITLNSNPQNYYIMKRLSICIFFFFNLVNAQQKNEIKTYNYGHNSIEIISKQKDSTIIVSTYNAKMDIRKEIAQEILNLYLDKKLKNNKSQIIIGKEASITGDCIITQKGTLTSIEFYYEKVDWNNGLTEYYANPKATTTLLVNNN